MGNIDPIKLLMTEGTTKLEEKVRNLIERGSETGGHILNTGGQIAVETPEENVKTVIQAARKYWK